MPADPAPHREPAETPASPISEMLEMLAWADALARTLPSPRGLPDVPARRAAR